MKALLPYLPIVLLVANLATVWICWSLRQVAKAEIGAAVKVVDDKHTLITNRLDERADAHHDRLTVAEGHIKEVREDISNLPTKADIEKVAGKVEKVSAEVGAVGAGVSRLEGFFLKRGVENA